MSGPDVGNDETTGPSDADAGTGENPYSVTPTEPARRGGAFGGVLFTIGLIVVASGLIVALIFGVKSALGGLDFGVSQGSDSGAEGSGVDNGDDDLKAETFYKGPLPERFTYQIDDSPKVGVVRTGRWDHRSCKGIARSSVMKSLLADGGCRYGIEQAVKSQQDTFSMGQHVLVFPNAAAAGKVEKAIDEKRVPGDFAFRFSGPSPTTGATVGFGRVDVLDKYVVISGVTIDTDSKPLSEASRKLLGKEVSTAFAFMHAESVNVLRFR